MARAPESPKQALVSGVVLVLWAMAAGAPSSGATLLSRDIQRQVRPVFPGADWETRTPAQVGLGVASLDAIRDYLGGRGAIVRGGYLIYTWGDVSMRVDVASAAKPLYAHFLLEAVEQGLLASVDEPVQARAPCVGPLNPSLGYKDRAITFRHMANQVSGYGVSEAPGRAFDYSDWQMALFWDALFLEVWNTTYAGVDSAVLGPGLASILQFQDQPTFMAFGPQDRPGRLAISARDLCRFGFLYLRRGSWNGVEVLSQEMTLTAVTRALPLPLPRTTALPSQMCAGQRTLGSSSIPDDQYDHDGGYAWNWWVNGITRGGWRRWPHAEANVFAALGHGGGEGLVVVPCLDLVLSWNDTTPRPLDEVMRRLYEAAAIVPGAPPHEVGPVLRLDKGAGGTLRLDWGTDQGGPRGPSQHYHVLRGIGPTALDLVPATHPHTATEFSELVHGDPLVFYRIVAASTCEHVSDD